MPWVFILIGLISSSENNRSQRAKPPPRQHACSPFGQFSLHEREKRGISQPVPPGPSRAWGGEHMLNALTFPAPWSQGPFLCVWFPGLTDHLSSLNSRRIIVISLLSSPGGQKTRTLGTGMLYKRKCPKRTTQTILPVQLFKIIPGHHIHHETRGRIIFPHSGFVVNMAFLSPQETRER